MLLFARTSGLVEPDGDEEPRLPPLTPLALVALSERMRPDAAATVAYLHRTGVARQDHLRRRAGDGGGSRARRGHRHRRARDDRGGAPAGVGRAASQRDRQRRLRARPARAQAPARGGAATRRPARRDDRRRRQRRSRPQGVRCRRGTRLGQPAREGRRRRRARDRELRVDPLRDRGGAQDPAQRPARGQAVRHEVRVRRDCSSSRSASAAAPSRSCRASSRSRRP